ncbi:MAG: hypothetical protein CME06_09880 [Gemmatimonadetes bacterium]|nr:hypothetical protein [Gemmatimonadota bacterium]
MITPLQLLGLILALIGVGQSWKNPKLGGGMMVLGAMILGIGTVMVGGRFNAIVGTAWTIVVPVFAVVRSRTRARDAARAAEARESLDRLHSHRARSGKG